jgi:hypothetical protein
MAELEWVHKERYQKWKKRTELEIGGESDHQKIPAFQMATSYKLAIVTKLQCNCRTDF